MARAKLGDLSDWLSMADGGTYDYVFGDSGVFTARIEFQTKQGGALYASIDAGPDVLIGSGRGWNRSTFSGEGAALRLKHVADKAGDMLWLRVRNQNIQSLPSSDVSYTRFQPLEGDTLSRTVRRLMLEQQHNASRREGELRAALDALQRRLGEVEARPSLPKPQDTLPGPAGE